MGRFIIIRILKKEYNLKTTTNSDTEVFVELFERIGKKVFQEVEGMFAVCIFSLLIKILFS